MNIVKLESEITVILLGLLISLCGLTFGILISNKILAVKFKLMSFSTIGMFFTVLIGGMIMGSLVGLCFEAGFFNPPIIQKIDAVFPFSALIFVLMACLGGFLGAMLWSKKLKQEEVCYEMEIWVKNIKNIAITILLSILLCEISYILPIFELFELDTLDFRFNFQNRVKIFEDIVIIDIDDETIRQFGQMKGGTRVYYANVIDYLNQGGAKTIGFDMLFPEKSTIFPEGDQELANATGRARNVCHSIFFYNRESWGTNTFPDVPKLLKRFSYGENCAYYPADEDIPAKEEPILEWEENDSVYVPIEPILKKTARIGHINIYTDIDGIVRKIQYLMPYMGEIYPFLAFQLACDYLGIKKEDIKIVKNKFIDMGKIKIPIDREGKTFINYKLSSVRKFPFHMVLKREIPAEYFKNKIVLIGGTYPPLFDTVPTSIELIMPRAEFHANIIYSIIKGNFIFPIEKHLMIIICILLGVITGLAYSFFSPLKSIIITIILLIGYLILVFCLFEFKGIYIEIIRPILIVVSMRLLFLEKSLISIKK
ncbi:MAG: CHASE2 domain-containing protein [bacterium]